jgi:hypothetical protein
MLGGGGGGGNGMQALPYDFPHFKMHPRFSMAAFRFLSHLPRVQIILSLQWKTPSQALTSLPLASRAKLFTLTT